MPCAVCHNTVYVSVFSGQVVSARHVVVRTGNQNIPKIPIWLSVTIFGCLGQPDNHFYKPCIHVPDCGFQYTIYVFMGVQSLPNTLQC